MERKFPREKFDHIETTAAQQISILHSRKRLESNNQQLIKIFGDKLDERGS